MKYARILAELYGTPVAILPEKYETIRAFLESKAKGEDVPPETVAAIAGSRRPDGVTVSGKVAVLPVFGVISQRAGLLEQASGGVSAERVGALLDGLVADDGVKSIV